MRIGSLFSGFGGLDLGVQAVLGGTVAWHVENDSDASAVLAHHWPDTRNLGDITRVDWSQVDRVDVLTGGFPCQDLSTAGQRAGLRPDTRSGLWSQMAYAVSVLRPRLVIAENVRGLLSARADCQVEPCPWCLGDDTGSAMRALGVILADLADLGYDAAWCGLRAADVGAPHGRFRVFVVAADADSVGPLRARAPRGRESEPAHDGSATPDRERHALRQQPVADGGRGGAPVTGDDCTRVGDFGSYEPAVRRWESLLDRNAPVPTVDGRRADRVLNPAFVEWMQGVEPGWVTDVPNISRGAALRILGNGVVPQQVSAALPWLLTTLAAPMSEAP
ncbi:DNA (cytosine-5-)-methyltransferase [Lentzea sp. NPDC051208]|uniref:DNA cytosine methyltransferase n=1 Tax=Lentzea sp. NPDC051208 TaxID=3154642 RepID=UPI0034142D83